MGLATWERAKMLGEYHLAEAVRVQRMAEGDALEYAALKVARWAMDSGIMEFSIRTLCKFGPRPRMQTREAELVMEFMIELHWAKQLPPSPGERAVRFGINPNCRHAAIAARAKGGK